MLRNLLQRVKKTENIFDIVMAIAVGILAGFGAIAFKYLISFFSFLATTRTDPTLAFLSNLPWWWKISIPGIAGLIVGLLIPYAKEIRGSGIPEVIASAALHEGRIRTRVVFLKTLASAIYIGGNGSVGREGPIVQIGSGLGSSLATLLGLSPRRVKALMSCGAAAGIAATFNAPIAGSLFALEVILGGFGIPQFSLIVISCVTATVISYKFSGDLPTFIIPQYEPIHFSDIWLFAILGIFTAIAGVTFIKTRFISEDMFDSIPLPIYVKTTVGGLCIGAIGLLIPQIYGVGYETITEMLAGRTGLWFLFFLLIGKLVATSIALGSGGSGGIFAPSLFLGAALGGLTGQLVNIYFPGVAINPGAFAIVGMGAFVAVTTRAPVTAILMIFELTNNYRMVLPVMFASIVAIIIARRLEPESIYTIPLLRRGIDIKAGHEVNILKQLHVRDVISKSIATIRSNTTFQKIMDLMMNSKYNYFYVVNSRDELEGVISSQSIRPLINEAESLKTLLIAGELAREVRFAVLESESLDRVMHIFGEYHVDELPVIDSLKSKKVIGSVWKKDVISLYNTELFKRDMAGEFVNRIDQTATKKIRLFENQYVMEIPAPVSFIGKSIRNLDVRAIHNVEILFIKKSDIQPSVPHGEYIIEDEDILVILGEERKINLIQKL